MGEYVTMMSSSGGMRFGRRSATAACLTAFLVLSASLAEAKPARTYQVKPGDTLSHIALSKLGKARKWVPLYRANRKVVGPNPNLIFPGQVLVLSPAAPAAKKAVFGQATPKPPRVTPPSELPVVERPSEEPVEPAPVAADPEPIPEPVAMPESVAATEPEPVMTLPEAPTLQAGPNPWVAAGASTLFPGTGQALNGNWVRGGLYAGAALALYGASLYGRSAGDATISRASGIALLGISLAAPIDAYFTAPRPVVREDASPQKEARK